MNKKMLFLVGIKMNIDYMPKYTWFFSRSLRQENTQVKKEWLIRNAKYIYASCQEEAIAKYKLFYEKIYISLSSWRDWYSYSENISLNSINNKCFKIQNQECVIIKEDVVSVTIKDLKENISATDFRDWWHYHCDDITEVLNND